MKQKRHCGKKRAYPFEEMNGISNDISTLNLIHQTKKHKLMTGAAAKRNQIEQQSGIDSDLTNNSVTDDMNASDNDENKDVDLYISNPALSSPHDASKTDYDLQQLFSQSTCPTDVKSSDNIRIDHSPSTTNVSSSTEESSKKRTIKHEIKQQKIRNENMKQRNKDPPRKAERQNPKEQQEEKSPLKSILNTSRAFASNDTTTRSKVQFAVEYSLSIT